MNLPEKGSPDRLHILQAADIDDLMALSYEELSDMSIEELRLISARLDEHVRENEKKLEDLRAKAKKKSEGTAGDATKYQRHPYFTDPKHDDQEELYLKQKQTEEVKKKNVDVRSLELKGWAQDVRFKNLMMQYRCAMKDVRTRLEIIDMSLETKYHRHCIKSITDRIKDPESIQRKLLKKEKPVEIGTLLNDNPLYDIAGIRVICAFKDDVYRVEKLLEKQDGITLLEGRRKDYIDKPREARYRSLHLGVTVPVYIFGEMKDTRVEIQIRTLAMDFWSSLEHDIKYKHIIANEEKVQERLQKCADKIAALDDEMMEIRDLAEMEE